ncbi:MAG TPA: hypothetical protein VIY48_10425 [Candidatus Paceibacterota bacterium]
MECPICGAVEGTGLKPFEFVDDDGRDWSFCYSGADHGETEINWIDQKDYTVTIPNNPFMFTHDVNNYADPSGRKISGFYNPDAYLFVLDFQGRQIKASTIPWDQVTDGCPIGGYPESNQN